MNVFIIIGPQAVGKMTVGQELGKKTGARLFHNHMTIDLIENFFPYGTAQGDSLVKAYRRLLFHEVCNSYDYPGFIFTFLCDFASDDGKPFLMETCKMFADHGHDVYIIELYSDYNIRKRRNYTLHRLRYKKSKRNIVRSSKIFEHFETTTRANSTPGEITWPNYYRLDNSKLSPRQIVNHILTYVNTR